MGSCRKTALSFGPQCRCARAPQIDLLIFILAKKSAQFWQEGGKCCLQVSEKEREALSRETTGGARLLFR